MNIRTVAASVAAGFAINEVLDASISNKTAQMEGGIAGGELVGAGLVAKTMESGLARGNRLPAALLGVMLGGALEWAACAALTSAPFHERLHDHSPKIRL